MDREELGKRLAEALEPLKQGIPIDRFYEALMDARERARFFRAGIPDPNSLCLRDYVLSGAIEYGS